MRIIAGSAKGSRIFTPKGQDTRPTQDRVRESLFNMLRGDVEGAEVLDLFAGSGALSLEAVSRGAAGAVAVDRARDAAACVGRNIAKLGLEARVQVMNCDWQKAAGKLCEAGKRFDLVFLDPPYRVTETGAICESLAALGLLREEALIVVEHRRGEKPAPGEAFARGDTRRYGDTEISFFRYRPAGE